MTVASPIPIAFCITELNRGGAERALTQLVVGLDRNEWSPRVFCLGPRGHFVDELESSGIPVICFDAQGAASFLRVTVQLASALRRFRPAILQTFLFHGNLVGRFAGRLAGVPKIVSGLRVAERRNLWYGRLDRWTNWLVDQNVCVSQGVADFSAQVTGLLPRKLTVIPNGVDLNRFSCCANTADLTELGIPANSPVVMTIGRLEQQKGIDHLLRAASIVLKQHGECKFLIVGDGPDRASLEMLASDLGITSAVVFTGGRSDVPELLKAATLFVLSSLWEGMPNALLEAMATPLPSVATAVEGSREVIDHGANGLLVQPADPAGLADAILLLLGDREMSARLAREAQVTILNRFTSYRVTSVYHDLYRKLVSGN